MCTGLPSGASPDAQRANSSMASFDPLHLRAVPWIMLTQAGPLSGSRRQASSNRRRCSAGPSDRPLATIMDCAHGVGSRSSSAAAVARSLSAATRRVWKIGQASSLTVLARPLPRASQAQFLLCEPRMSRGRADPGLAATHSSSHCGRPETCDSSVT